MDEPTINASPPVNPPTKVFDWKKKGLPIIIAAIAIIALGGVSYWAAQKVKDNQAATTTTDITTNTDTDATTDTTTLVLGEPTWLTEPQKLADLGLFVCDPSPCDAEAKKYYKVGTDTSRDIILVEDYEGMGPVPSLFVKISADKYVFLKQHSTGYDPVPVSTKTSVDSTSAYKSLVYQESLTINGVAFAGLGKDYSSHADPTNYSSYKEYATTSYGKVYQLNVADGEGMERQSFILKLPDFMNLAYQLRPPFVADDSVPQVTWKDGKANKDAYRIDGLGGCGNGIGGVTILKTNSLSGLTESGATKGGEKVYEFTSADNPTLKFYYDQYKLYPPEGGVLSMSEYRAKHAVFVYQDKLNRLVVFNSVVYGPAVECGKPVVYLYPTQPTQVSVQVDANITKSDPFYGNGWNTLAMPNGDLYVGGKKYPNLFWEGTGHEYPAITGGTVVAQADLQTTLVTQLHQLGLNDKESADFMEFWGPKMPTTPYTRLTWFGTREMDRLAPLTVTPKPDTTIRIFLDFEGLQQKVSMPAQRLSAPARRGFTVVEWGGLLRTAAATPRAN